MSKHCENQHYIHGRHTWMEAPPAADRHVCLGTGPGGPVPDTAPVHLFTVVLERAPTDPEFDAAHAFGISGDASFGTDGGVAVCEFDRQAATYEDAVALAKRDLEAVGLKPVRVLRMTRVIVQVDSRQSRHGISDVA